MARKKLKKITIQFYFNISLHFTEIDTMVRSVDNQVYHTPSFSLSSTSLPSTEGKYSQITERNAAKLPNEGKLQGMGAVLIEGPK